MSQLETIQRMQPDEVWALVQELEVIEMQTGWFCCIEAEFFWMPTHRTLQ